MALSKCNLIRMQTKDIIFSELLKLVHQQGHQLTATYPGIVGLVIAVLRREKGWSQQALAQHSGVSQTTISRIELAEAEMTISQIGAIAEAFGTTSTFLIGVSEEFRERLQEENISVPLRVGKTPAPSNSEAKKAATAAAIVTAGAMIGGGPIGFLLGSAIAAIIISKKDAS